MKYEFNDFWVEKNQVYIKKHVKKAKPITGTKIGAITGDNPWSSPFVVFMDMYRFAIPFEMTVQIEKGMEYEPYVIKGVNSLNNTKFSDYTSTPYYDWDVNSPLGSKYNGKIDGWDAKKKIILECKVTSRKNLSKWIKNQPPKYYLLQMLLYAKLAEAEEIWLSGYFLDPEDYDLPTKTKIENHKLRIWKYKFDNTIKEFLESKLKIAENFIENNINKRISPKFDPSKKCDREVLDFLKIPY